MLWLLDGGETARTNLRQQARLAGVEEGRVVFAPLVGKEEHLQRLRLADVFVDTPVKIIHARAFFLSSSLGTGVTNLNPPPPPPQFFALKRHWFEAGQGKEGGEREAVALSSGLCAFCTKNSFQQFGFDDESVSDTYTVVPGRSPCINAPPPFFFAPAVVVQLSASCAWLDPSRCFVLGAVFTRLAPRNSRPASSVPQVKAL